MATTSAWRKLHQGRPNTYMRRWGKVAGSNRPKARAWVGPALDAGCPAAKPYRWGATVHGRNHTGPCYKTRKAARGAATRWVNARLHRR